MRKCLRPLHTESEIFACVFRIPHPFLSKCMQLMRKRKKSNLIWIFFDGRKFRRQCANVIDTTWGRIHFLTCENFGRKFRTQCAETFTLGSGHSHWKRHCVYNRMVFLKAAATLPSNTKVATCYYKQNLATLAPPLRSSDWSTDLELILMSGAACKS